MTIACIGEVMIELSAPEGSAARVGTAGDTFNWAVYLRRSLGEEHRVRYVTALGHDPFSARITKAIEAEGIATDRILRHPTRLPGLYAITLDHAGERSFHYWRSEAAARTMFDDDAGIDALDGADVVALSGITLAILPDAARERLFAHLATARADGLQVAFDSNYRPALWPSGGAAREVMERMWALTDIALPSVDDEMAMAPNETAEAIAARFSAMPLRAGALKRGATGPLGLTTGAAPDLPAVTRVVDSTAAGDSFNGAFLGAVLQGGDEAAALAAGHACASRVICHHGAIVPRADWDA
ncbi:hypothetical protein ATO11_08990 [Pseudaestuariivita atlantica]|uniref:Carbohydrate kinase PfkB domain-containing protein n=1 Tax=Pseudaestuariivita atlantica TaxID=1317121 RepID=A0A0L1JRW4_9RHOB|nr:hypothetical protein ATO11_08990 [Pseudaestuariivita atlantica]